MKALSLNIKSNGLSKSFCRQTNGHTDKQTGQNRCIGFTETSQKLPLGDVLSQYFKDLNIIKNSGCQIFKNLLGPNGKG